MGYSEEEIYNLLKDIPLKRADDNVIPGALVLEGGAFRGVYQEGVLDCLMMNGFNFETTIGVSAGALNGVSYTSGQIGRRAHVNMRYRHDGRYVGINAFIKSRLKSVIGFNYIFGSLPEIPDLDVDAIKNNGRKLIAVATNMENGKAVYFDNKREDILKCVQASSTLPYISKPVMIDNVPYFDGGCSDRIPFKWAMDNKYKKIIVIRTRDKKYRAKTNFDRKYLVTKRIYSSYNDFAINLAKTDDDYNILCDKLDELEKNGEVFVIAPSIPINIKMLEGDLEKLKYIYELGYKDCESSLDALRDYLRRN